MQSLSRRTFLGAAGLAGVAAGGLLSAVASPAWAQDWVTGDQSDRKTWTVAAKAGALLTIGATLAEARAVDIETSSRVRIRVNGSQPLVRR